MTLPNALFRALARATMRLRFHDASLVQEPSGGLIVANFPAWSAPLAVAACLGTGWTFVVPSDVPRLWLLRLLLGRRKVIPFSGSLKTFHEVKLLAERQGRMVLFPEVRSSPSGKVEKLAERSLVVLRRFADKEVLFAHTHVIYDRKNRPHARAVHFFRSRLPAFTTAEEVLDRLRSRFAEHQFHVYMREEPTTLCEAILTQARRFPGKPAVEDLDLESASVRSLSYRALTVTAKLLGQKVEHALAGDPSPGRRVGVLLPNTIAMVATLLGCWLHGRLPAILNYTVGEAGLIASLRLAGIHTVVTSRLFCEKVGLPVERLRSEGFRILFLEEIKTKISFYDKIFAMVKTISGPVRSPARGQGSATAVILFTSGSEGTPKGVELTHANLLANTRQLFAGTDLQRDERFFAALPFFHSFGLTVGVLLPLTRGMTTFAYPTPLHYKEIPQLIYERASTIFLSTNTFLNGYARKASRADFLTLRRIYAGAEKVQLETHERWATDFGVRILEGYGTTEASPVVAVNSTFASRVGSVGRTLPGVEVRTVAVEGVPRGGRLLIKGPNLMKGYLNEEAQRKFQERGGWYDTGDVVEIDDQGFLHILGRIKRFAKIGGEMVSMGAVEEALLALKEKLGGDFDVAVLGRPDAAKGECLVAICAGPQPSTDEVRAAILGAGLSTLSLPREIVKVEALPKLGTGKTDYRALAQILEG